MVDLLFTAAALSLSLVLVSFLNSVVNHGVNLSDTFIVRMGACFSWFWVVLAGFFFVHLKCYNTRLQTTILSNYHTTIPHYGDDTTRSNRQ